jgi:ABC-type nickel/cobalt efflux system permease component RcnA
MRAVRAGSLAAAALALAAATAHASQSPFGIATPDSTGGSWFGGPFGPVFAWIAVHQSHFYRALTSSLGDLKDNPAGLWLLFGLSFAYGVFHAAGPGHGKAVITSYLLASGHSARRGIGLSFLSAMVQAASAIIIVAIGAIVLKVSATAMTFATDWIEIVSYAAIALFGAWLLWSKIRGDHHHHHHHHVGGDVAHQQGRHDHGHHHHDDHGHTHENGHDHSHDAHGHDHAAPAPRGGWLAKPWAAVLSVGIRPCSGAIIVLVFALSQGLFAAGVAATVVMALGTGLTVAALAVLAVSAKGLALRLAGGNGSVAMLARGVEIAGAAAVLVLGLLLLGGALATGLPGAG